ncbi:MAG TPA: hypothetical protein PKD83_04270 [Ignavibacteria bacterium]|nr:hypothetical protein [Ignavibacteria bacterium]
MLNSNKINLKLIFGLFSLMFFTNTVYSGENSIRPDYYYGKVVYSDNNIPVNGGFVKIYFSANGQNAEKIIAITEIQTNGVFKFPRSLITQTDGIKIMAYANDIDNNQILFESKTTDFMNLLTKGDGKYDLLISVKRATSFEEIE